VGSPSAGWLFHRKTIEPEAESYLAVQTPLFHSDQPFEIVSDFTPSGDQPVAIERLTANIEAGLREQVLLGVTGSARLSPWPCGPTGAAAHPGDGSEQDFGGAVVR
jgi:hypothetical protein